jgi:hypothetical protein
MSYDALNEMWGEYFNFYPSDFTKLIKKLERMSANKMVDILSKPFRLRDYEVLNEHVKEAFIKEVKTIYSYDDMDNFDRLRSVKELFPGYEEEVWFSGKCVAVPFTIIEEFIKESLKQ